MGESGFEGAHIKLELMPLHATALTIILLKTNLQLLNIGFRPSSQRVVGITTGTTTTIEFPEGTGSPFGVGNLSVAITVTGSKLL